MLLIDPDSRCCCGSDFRWAECCGRQLPLTLRYVPVRLLAPDDVVAAGCSRGGHCCRSVHVPLTAFDVFRISRFLGVPAAELLESAAVVTPEGGVEIDGTPACPFLEGNSCSIYDARPDSCRLYPYWQIPSGQVDWLVERHTCAGCWNECRSGRMTASAMLDQAGVAPGRQAEAVFQEAIRTLDEADVDETIIEGFMGDVYNGVPPPPAGSQHRIGDSLANSESEEPGADLERFRALVSRSLKEYLKS